MIRKCALSPSDMREAKGVILSFWSEWEDKFRSDEIRAVYRKIAPGIPTPGYLYIYLNKPAQKIIGRARLESIKKCSLEECLQLAPLSGYREEDIHTYAGRLTGTGLYVYSIGGFEAAPRPIPVKELATKFSFVPTPQAVTLSEQGIRELNGCLEFS